MARVQVVNTVTNTDKNDWYLSLQWCRYLYDDGNMEHGYRFIWTSREGRLQPARGQARLPSLKVARELMDLAQTQGWGDYTDDIVNNSASTVAAR